VRLGGTPAPAARAFTLLELLIVLFIVAILTGLMLMAVGQFRARAQRAQCMANLRNLGVAANLYIQENQQWPQVYVIANKGKTEQEFAELWIGALQPYGVQRKTWICPTLEGLLGNPDYEQPENARLDYIATPFDDKPASPHQWPGQPWFTERDAVHGKGSLILFPDGHIVQSEELTLK
jgi:prepilin-type N-terminal cleavage/methylation domain-containing protein